MKKIKVRFEQDPTVEYIDVLVRAPVCDREVSEYLERIAGKPPDVLTVTGGDGSVLRVDSDDIISVSVSGKQSEIVTRSVSYTVRQSLQSLESGLDPGRFVRISRYELVNLDKVRKYDFSLGGTLRLELEGGRSTWASRRCIPEIRKRLNETKEGGDR